MKGNEGARLCELNDASEIRAFSADPTAVCRRCGAKAHDADNLCDPVQITDAG